MRNRVNLPDQFAVQPEMVTAADAERISGMAQVTKRDLIRHGVMARMAGGSYHPMEVAQMMLITGCLNAGMKRSDFGSRTSDRQVLGAIIRRAGCIKGAITDCTKERALKKNPSMLIAAAFDLAGGVTSGGLMIWTATKGPEVFATLDQARQEFGDKTLGQVYHVMDLDDIAEVLVKRAGVIGRLVDRED